MSSIKVIQTYYNGYLFRSRLEARWAVFFDACGVEYEYEPEGYDLGNGMMYLPDFLLHRVDGRAGGDLFVEVKGQMNDNDARKINRFAELGMEESDYCEKSKTAILVVGKLPAGDSIKDIIRYVEDRAYNDHKHWPNEFNFRTIDGDYFAAHPGVNRHGKFELFGDDSGYLAAMDPVRTEKAYRLARCARFEHGESPQF